MQSSPRAEFSHRTRVYNLARLRAELFDLLVIGGGLLGAGIAREAALRGYKVALVEKNDLASGSSSQSSKLLRAAPGCLEHLDFSRARRASRERRLLLRLAPNLVWTLPFLCPIYRDRRSGPWSTSLGLWVYDRLEQSGGGEGHQMVSTAQIAAQFPAFDVSHIVGGACWTEAQTDDARLTLETARSAHRHGAVVVNHVQVEALTRTVGSRVDGVGVRDWIEGEVINVRARVVVNAAGSWSDAVLALDAEQAEPRLRLVKAVYLLFPRDKFPAPQALAFTFRSDGRTLVVLPRGGFTLVGAAETEWQGDPDLVRADVGDVDYILIAIRQSFPGLHLGRGDVVSTYAGLRPALARMEGASGGFPRAHEIWITPSGLVNIAGGELTDYRAAAQELVARVAKILERHFGIHAPFPSRSARTPLMDGEAAPPETLSHAQAETARLLPEETRAHLNRAYGLRQGRVLDWLITDPKLRAPIVDGLPYIWAEAPHAVEQEMALTISDVMMRRLDLFHQVSDGAVIAARDIGLYIGKLLSWTSSDLEREARAYVDAVQLNREAVRA